MRKRLGEGDGATWAVHETSNVYVCVLWCVSLSHVLCIGPCVLTLCGAVRHILFYLLLLEFTDVMG